MRKMMLAAATTPMIVGLLVTIGCGPKGDPAVTGTGLWKEEALARLRVVNDLRPMALATDNYAGNYRDLLPPADGSGAVPWGAGEQKSPRRLVGLSWRAHLLEFMTSDQNQPGQERAVYTGLRDGKYARAPGAGPDDAWNVPELKTIRLAIVTCPVPDKTTQPWHTFYRVFVGNGAAFEPGKQLTWNDFSDGRDKTILIV